LQKQLTVFSCINGLYIKERSISTEVFPPTIYNSWTHYVQLAFFLPANKKNSEVSQFLKKISPTVVLTPAEVSDCFALEFLSNLPNDRRIIQFCDYLLENYIDADSNFPLLFDPNVLH